MEVSGNVEVDVFGWVGWDDLYGLFYCWRTCFSVFLFKVLPVKD